MSSRRLAIALLAALATAPVAARAAVPVAIYPFRVPGLSAAQKKDLQALIEAGLISAVRRGVLTPRSPIGLAVSCGEVPTAPCLGTAARDGLVLTGRGEIRGGVILVAASLWDRNGNHTREVRFVVDLVIQNLRPVNEAIAELEIEIEPDGTVSGSAKTPPPARDPRGAAVAVVPPPPPPPASRAAPPAAAVAAPIAALQRDKVLAAPSSTSTSTSTTTTPSTAAPKQAAAAPAPLPKPAPIKATPVDVSAPAPVKSSEAWKRQAGPLFTFVGAGLLAAGGVVAWQNRAAARDLESKYAAGGLTPGDKAAYDRVQQNNVVTAVLVGGGAVAVGAGTYLWFTAPPAGSRSVAMAGAGGSF
jgi:hypothetical protein